jgi:hypothetical protein
MAGNLLENMQQMDSRQEPIASSIPCSMSAKNLLPISFIPSPDTILCGRGKTISTAQGNRRLKMIVTQYLKPYSEARNKLEKSAIVSRIVNMVKQAAPEGNFVKLEHGRYWLVEDSLAREKVGCMFRDCLHTQYRSSTKAKLAQRRARKAVMDDLNGSSEHGHSSVSVMLQHHPSSGIQHPSSSSSSSSTPPKKDDIKHDYQYAQLQANYARARVSITSANKFRDGMSNSAHHDIVGDGAANLLVGKDKIFSALDQACEFMGLEKQVANSFSSANTSLCSILEACDTMGLEDSEDLPDDISGIFSNEEEEEEDEEDEDEDEGRGGESD